MRALAVETIAVADKISPVSQGAGTVTSGWVSMARFTQLMAIVKTGVLGTSATVDAKLQQASDSGGTGAKDITGKAITQLVKASNDNNQAVINLRPSDLDVANGFSYVRLSVTVGTAASLIDGTLLGFIPVNAPASSVDSAGVVQIVN